VEKMAEYDIVNRKTKKVTRTIKGVVQVTKIPQSYSRLWFKDGSSCKINTGSYDLRQMKD
jgi:hypothetical protein